MSIYAECDLTNEDDFDFERAARYETQLEHFRAERRNKNSCASCDHCEAWENADGTWGYVCVGYYGERSDLGSLDSADKCNDYKMDILSED